MKCDNIIVRKNDSKVRQENLILCNKLYKDDVTFVNQQPTDYGSLKIRYQTHVILMRLGYYKGIFMVWGGEKEGGLHVGNRPWWKFL